MDRLYINKILLSIFLFLIFPASCQAKRLYSENTYQKLWCDKHNGVMEYRLNDKTRVDCLTDTLAVEFDFANKWAECIGQALYYGRQTNRQPACVLIMERGEKDMKYLKRLRRAAYKKGVNMRTFTIKPEHICNPAIRPDCPHLQNKP